MEFYILTQVMFIWGMQEMGIDTDYLLLEDIGVSIIEFLYFS